MCARACWLLEEGVCLVNACVIALRCVIGCFSCFFSSDLLPPTTTHSLTDQNGQAEELRVQHALFGKVQACLGVHLAYTALCFDQEVECVLLCRS